METPAVERGGKAMMIATKMPKAKNNAAASMSRAKLFCVAHVVVLAVLLIGCEKKASDEIDFGTFNKSVYTNVYFGFSATIPASWSIQDQQSQRRLTKLGEDAVAGDDKNLKSLMNANELKTVNLFIAAKHPLGTPVTFNPSAICLADRVKDLPGIKGGKDYLFFAKNTLKSSAMHASFPKEVYTERVGGVDFDVLDVEIFINGITIKEKLYATIMKGYALSFVVTFTNDEEASSARKILDTVKFQ